MFDMIITYCWGLLVRSQLSTFAESIPISRFEYILMTGLAIKGLFYGPFALRVSFNRKNK